MYVLFQTFQLENLSRHDDAQIKHVSYKATPHYRVAYSTVQYSRLQYTTGVHDAVYNTKSVRNLNCYHIGNYNYLVNVKQKYYYNGRS